MKNGIDVSKHNGVIDFGKVKAAGIDFVIIRAGFGKLVSQKDTMFEINDSKAKAAGLDVGVYWYSYAASIEEGRAEARACLECIKGKTFEYPVYFDLEEQKQFAKGKDFCSQLIDVFCGEIQNAGYWAGLYTSKSYLQTHISAEIAKKYALWVAQWSSKCTYQGSYGMWQKSEKGRIDGISGNVDLDECYIDYPKEIRTAGKNGYKKAENAGFEVFIRFDDIDKARTVAAVLNGAEIRTVVS